jgi:hypothetical protein
MPTSVLDLGVVRGRGTCASAVWVPARPAHVEFTGTGCRGGGGPPSTVLGAISAASHQPGRPFGLVRAPTQPLPARPPSRSGPNRSQPGSMHFSCHQGFPGPRLFPVSIVIPASEIFRIHWRSDGWSQSIIPISSLGYAPKECDTPFPGGVSSPAGCGIRSPSRQVRSKPRQTARTGGVSHLARDAQRPNS